MDAAMKRGGVSMKEGGAPVMVIPRTGVAQECTGEGSFVRHRASFMKP
jgi:hypothetical protein